MPLRLLPWSPEYGTGMQFDADEGAETDPSVDCGLEGSAWQAIAPEVEPPAAVQIVDGVRRAEAHAMDEAPDGSMLLGLFGSFAIGAVRCDEGRAHILEDVYRVERRYLQTGGEPRTREVAGGGMTLRFRAEVPAEANTANDLVAALNRTMLDEEAKLAERLSDDESVLTFVDGPLRLRSPGARVVGYVKRVHRWYLPSDKQRLLLDLRVGERTPLFRIMEDNEDPESSKHSRTSWFLRLADLDRHMHPLGGVLRLEVPAALPLQEARRLADQSAVVLPRLASSPVRDPRSPQNLLPVGALEAALTHRLGDRRRISRLLAASIRDTSIESEVAA